MPGIKTTYRTFSGKRYRADVAYGTKGAARKEAEKLRRGGDKARVVKLAPRQYAVFYID